jgi:hypothetical protein
MRREMPVIDLLSIIEKETSLKIVFNVGLGNKAVSIKAEEVTPTEAVKLVTKAAGLSFRETSKGVYFIENLETKRTRANN